MGALRLLDTFCKAGGAAEGYRRAGFLEIVGVDIQPQPNYPFEFVQADAIEYIKAHGKDFDMIHASPPCQAHSKLRSLGKARNGFYPEHEDLVGETRDALSMAGVPYVIENVPGAPLCNPVKLCGCQFPSLRSYRPRLFESSFPIQGLEHRPHKDSTPSAGNGISPKGFISVCGSGGVKGLNSEQILSYWSIAMGIHWMTRAELSQAVPPAFTEYVGAQFMLWRYNQGREEK